MIKPLLFPTPQKNMTWHKNNINTFPFANTTTATTFCILLFCTIHGAPFQLLDKMLSDS